MIALLFCGCAVGGKYFHTSHPLDCHYQYSDDTLKLGAQIRSDIFGDLRYHFVILNKGDVPIYTFYYMDALGLVYEKKLYRLGKMCTILGYPDLINPNTIYSLSFRIDRRFKNVINDVSVLHFKFNDTIYTLEKNAKAQWE